MAFRRREHPGSVEDEREALRAQRLALDELKRELAERVRAVREREAYLERALADIGSGPIAEDAQASPPSPAADDGVAAREAEIAARERAPTAAANDQGDDRLARIEARLAELAEAEKLFLRTRDELAARSEAVAARERLVAQRERELDERDAGAGAAWTQPELTEMEARLRRLEQQRREQELGFSGGLRRLQQHGTRPRADE
ncbi:hypothetical protein Gocc_2531 [Gaiella occulta]|uniref:Uncharacterized protein n=1 Tax=Gaiella occulta TaxID=1002870 RepID=A0A7M2YWW2_9ACTN|nr:hypothetical protein [Gaiella occulta]RDI73967.1 hypothetical protein Gocc_2531 [Gaiella occulta]